MITIPNDPKHTLSLKEFYTDDRPRCSVCQRSRYRYVYLCSFSKLPVCYKCVKKPLIIDPKRSHEHPLHMFLKGFFSFPCDACGVNDAKSCLCLCIPCRFTIHRDCVKLPRVICIDYHDHRIAHVPSLGPGDWFCRICRKKVDGMYGAYSCLKCSLVCHARCATRSDVWDRIELEGVPEEDPAGIAPYEVVEEGVIKHFAHQHNLRLINEYDDKNKQCNGCVLPIFSNTRYICTVACDFILHETCANLLKKTRHPSRSRQLTLHAESIENLYEEDQGPFKCTLCKERCSGFAYVDGTFKIDVRCASIYDGYVHKSQPQSMLVVSENRLRDGLNVIAMHIFGYF